MIVLQRHEDAFGAGLLEHLQDRALHQVIIERDDGLVEPDFGVDGYFAGYRRWPAHERAAIQLVRGRVLDVGCGAGRVALHLQREHDVVGIDVSPLAVKVCKLRGVNDVRRLSATQIDARLGRFDTVVMMGNNLGLLANAKRAVWMLRRLRSVTTGAARIIGSTVDPYQTTDPDHLAYHRRNRARGRVAGQVRLRIRYRTLATPWFDYLFLSAEELERIAGAAGWQLTQCLRDEGPGYVAVLDKIHT